MSKVTNFEYDLPGRMTRFFQPSTPTVATATNTYDTLGRVKTQTDAAGNLYNYYFAGTRSEEVTLTSTSLVNYFDDIGNVIRAIDRGGRTTSSVYDGYSRLILRTSNDGQRLAYTYDDATCASQTRCTHNIASEIRSPKTGSTATPLQSYTYDVDLQPDCHATDARGAQTNYTYEATTGLSATITEPADAAGLRPLTTHAYTSLPARQLAARQRLLHNHLGDQFQDADLDNTQN